MQSASSTASGSGLQSAKRPVNDTESKKANWRPVGNGHWSKQNAAWSTVSKHQTKNCSEGRTSGSHHIEEAVHGYREKAMRIASVEQVKLGNIMELSITGHVLKWARQSNLSKGLSLSKARITAT